MRKLALCVAVGLLLLCSIAAGIVGPGRGFNSNTWLNGRYLGGNAYFGFGHADQFQALARYGAGAYPWRVYDSDVLPGTYNSYYPYGFYPQPDYGRRLYEENYVYNARYGPNVFSPRFGEGIVSPRYGYGYTPRYGRFLS